MGMIFLAILLLKGMEMSIYPQMGDFKKEKLEFIVLNLDQSSQEFLDIFKEQLQNTKILKESLQEEMAERLPEPNR